VVLLAKIKPSPLKAEIYVRLTTRKRHLNLSIIHEFSIGICGVRVKYDVRHNLYLRPLLETVAEVPFHQKSVFSPFSLLTSSSTAEKRNLRASAQKYGFIGVLMNAVEVDIYEEVWS